MTYNHSHNAAPYGSASADNRTWHEIPERLAEHLQIESRLSAPLRSRVIEQLAQTVTHSPATIIEMGSGTGADTVALAQRFPIAQVHALDISAELLTRVRSGAAAAGCSDRVTTHRVNLGEEWPTSIPHGVDIVWASLSIHHLGDPAAALRRARQALKPGGVLVLTELIGDATLTGLRDQALEDQLSRALASRHARDISEWLHLLEQAGFDGIETQEHDFVARADSEDGAKYLVSTLAGVDLDGVDEIIDRAQSRDSSLAFVAPRGVWFANRPLTEPR